MYMYMCVCVYIYIYIYIYIYVCVCVCVIKAHISDISFEIFFFALTSKQISYVQLCSDHEPCGAKFVYTIYERC